MKAAVYEKYGPPEVFQIKEIPEPTPKDNEVLINVHATTVTTYDCWVRSSTAPAGFWLLSRIDSGIRGPKQTVLGTELAGEIKAVGNNVTRFKQGDPVFAFAGMNLGAYAEYVCVPEDAVVMKPANISYEEAAALPQGALTALFFLRKGNIQRGQRVLIYGASGGVGNYAVQLAKHHFGAHVTGVCSTGKTDMVKALGADQIIDYTQADYTQNGQTYDVIFDTVGKSPILRSKRSLKKEGYYLFATFGLPRLVQMLWLSLTSDRHVILGLLQETTEDLMLLKELTEAGKLTAVIDRCFPLADIADAHRYVESGHKQGNVVITVKH